jgi:hypothetical protein
VAQGLRIINYQSPEQGGHAHGNVDRLDDLLLTAAPSLGLLVGRKLTTCRGGLEAQIGST